MDFRFSEEVHQPYETHGLADGIPLRIHKDQFTETKAALQAQRDWSSQVYPVDRYYGGLGQCFSFIRVTIPECLPDRLEIVSYANEFAFLYDVYDQDAMENLDLKNNCNSDPFVALVDIFGRGALDRKTGAQTRPEKRLQAKILSRMMVIDEPRAVTSMKAWSSFVQLAAQTRKSSFETLDEYIPGRVVDSGELFWFGMLTFGMALTIPPEEYHACMELARPGYIVLGLTNDLYSWDKERAAAEAEGQDYVFNAVWVVMREHAVGETEAKEICKSEIKRYVSEYRDIVEQAKSDTRLSSDLRTYLEAVLLSCSGNLVWSITCPRYRETNISTKGLSMHATGRD
ncbi:Isoprenoid synthase domain containing protein [Rhypophila decipiens]